MSLSANRTPIDSAKAYLYVEFVKGKKTAVVKFRNISRIQHKDGAERVVPHGIEEVTVDHLAEVAWGKTTHWARVLDWGSQQRMMRFQHEDAHPESLSTDLQDAEQGAEGEFVTVMDNESPASSWRIGQAVAGSLNDQNRAVADKEETPNFDIFRGGRAPPTLQQSPDIAATHTYTPGTQLRSRKRALQPESGEEPPTPQQPLPENQLAIILSNQRRMEEKLDQMINNQRQILQSGILSNSTPEHFPVYTEDHPTTSTAAFADQPTENRSPGDSPFTSSPTVDNDSLWLAYDVKQENLTADLHQAHDNEELHAGQPQANNYPNADLLASWHIGKTPAFFATKVMTHIYTVEEMRGRNTTGKGPRGKEPLSPRRLDYIENETKERFFGGKNALEQGKCWNDVRKALDTKLRKFNPPNRDSVENNAGQ